MRLHLCAVLLTLAACSKNPDPGPTAEPNPDEPLPADPPERVSLTAEECEAQGGRVVGDIGDGAIHRADYRCPDGDQPPIGNITQAPDGDGPIAVEGSVCCPDGAAP